MKILLLSSKDTEKYGGSQPHKYRKMATALEAGGFSAIHCFVTTKDDLICQIAKEKPNLVFSGVDSTQDSDGNQSIADILEVEGVSYVGSDSKGLKTVLHKDIAKRLWEANNIKTPEFFIFTTSEKIENGDTVHQESFPLIVKPLCMGGSRGRSEKEL